MSGNTYLEGFETELRSLSRMAGVLADAVAELRGSHILMRKDSFTPGHIQPAPPAVEVIPPVNPVEPAPDAFDHEFERLILIERGYANNPNDSGGATRYGITEAVARANGYQGDMRALPLETAKVIYRNQYWQLLRLDEVHEVMPSVAAELFDTGVNAGTGTAARMLQRVLNVLNRRGGLWADMAVDGAIGPVTLAALRAYVAHRGDEAEPVLYAALNGLQVEHYVSLAERRQKDEDFAWGWLRTRIARAPWS